MRSLRRWLFATDDSVYECRQCGTTLPDRPEHCLNCGSVEIARYDADNYNAS